jgi:probable rRNA maturation factor
MAIRFFTNDIPFKLKSQTKYKKWIEHCALLEHCSINEINYIFCSDSFLLDLNKRYLHHNTLTDIITFDYSDQKDQLKGEIYISIERVRENATRFNTSFNHELARVIIHGALHLIGFRDKDPKEKAQMRKKEEACLSLLP